HRLLAFRADGRYPSASDAQAALADVVPAFAERCVAGRRELRDLVARFPAPAPELITSAAPVDAPEGERAASTLVGVDGPAPPAHPTRDPVRHPTPSVRAPRAPHAARIVGLGVLVAVLGVGTWRWRAAQARPPLRPAALPALPPRAPTPAPVVVAEPAPAA